MSTSVEKIKSKIDIVELVGSYVKLEKAGTNFKGKCPFHHEKTPSFFVSQERGSYYCFGCQAKGDIFSFIQEFEGVDFITSLKTLADKAGVKLERYDDVEKNSKQRLFEVLEIALLFFQRQLALKVEALDYLASRKLSDKTISDFRVGFAPDSWRDLGDYLKSKNISESEMLSVGLIKKSENSSSPYDVFRNRIMFPISDSGGRIVGFSGRILGKDSPEAPKYLNTPETEIFNKSEVLFGLDKAKKEIRIKDYSILVEGQMDLVMMHQVGVTNTVATSGTALTLEHLNRLKRLSNRMIMSFDGDTAGLMASDRGAKMALSLGMDLKVAQMPEGKDPADLAKDDKDELVNCLKNSKHIIDFYTDYLLDKNLKPRDLGKEITSKVLPYVSLIPSSVERAQFIKNIAQKSFIKEEALWDDLKNISLPKSSDQSQSKNNYDSMETLSVERRLIGILESPRLLESVEIGGDDLEKKLRELLGNRFDEVLSEVEKEKDTFKFEIENYFGTLVSAEREVRDLLSILEEKYLKIKYTESMELLSVAEQKKDSEAILNYLQRCQEISQKINILKNSRK